MKPVAKLPVLVEQDEIISIQYLDTDQHLTVRKSRYLKGLKGRYRNWKLAGQAQFLQPDLCISQFLASSCVQPVSHNARRS